MTDELNPHMRRLVERAVRDETPAHPALKRRVRSAVALAVPVAAAFGSGTAGAAKLGVSGAATAIGAAKAGADLAAIATSPAGLGLLHGFWAWVAGGFLLGMGATGAYAGWTEAWSESSDRARSGVVMQPNAPTRAEPRTRSPVVSRDETDRRDPDAHPTVPAMAATSNTATADSALTVAATSVPATSGRATSVAVNSVAATSVPVNSVPATSHTTRIVVPEEVPPQHSPQAAADRTSLQAAPVGETWIATAPERVPSLAEEVSLLARVQQQLQKGAGETALAIIEEATRRFPSGQLQPDLQAARVLALCQIGQVENARRAADSFLHGRVASPLTQRVRHSCAFESTEQSTPRRPDF